MRSKNLLLAAAAAGLCVGFVACPVSAQTVSQDGRTVYEASYFTAFAPSNALQIVQRVPGFTLDLGNQEVRGFSQAAGNLVINGQRPSSKTDTLETILARIPASQVAKVEVGPGDLFGAEFTGKPQVANLILKSGAGVSGTISGSFARIFDGRYAPAGSISGLLRRGDSTINMSAGYEGFVVGENGFDRLTRLPSGELIELREKSNDFSDPIAHISGSWSLDQGKNRLMRLNFRFSQNWYDLHQDSRVSPAIGPLRDDVLDQIRNRREFEIGGDITRPLFGGGLKIIGLVTRRNQINHDTSLLRIDSDVIGGFTQDRDDQWDERVVRLVWNRGNVSGWSVEGGLEGVLNQLDSRVDLYSIDTNEKKARIDLPIDQAVVKEYRGEVFVNAGRPLSPALRMDLGITFEASRLTVSGDATAKRVLKFLKPKAAFDWRPGDGWHAQLSLERTVAQLEFDDFIGLAELANDRVSGGTTDLLPQRALEVRATIERPFMKDGLVKLEFGHDRISLVQDRVPTVGGLDAPGNIGDGQVFYINSAVEAPLGNLGIKGGRLTLNGTLRDTSVEDPYTGDERPLAGKRLWELDASFRQDLSRFAWGLSLYANGPLTYYRRSEVDTAYDPFPFLVGFIEYRPSSQTTLSLTVENLANISSTRERTFYLPDRGNLDPSLLELRRRNRHITPLISVKHSFG